MAIISTSDFKGIYELPKGTYTSADLQEVINQSQDFVLSELFGVDLYKLFKADLSSEKPQTQRFIDVFNAFLEQNEGNSYPFYVGRGFYPELHESPYGGYFETNQNKIMQSFGMKDMFCCFVYFKFASQLDVKVTQTGMKISDSETVKNATNNLRLSNLQTVYNRGIKSYQSIQWYMSRLHPTVYPEYKGICKETMNFGGVL